VKLPQNEGTPDRLVRIVAGALLAIAALAGLVVAPISYVAGVIAAILLITGVTGFCPLYAVFRFSTCPRRA
jgi:hypothetical protein